MISKKFMKFFYLAVIGYYKNSLKVMTTFVQSINDIKCY